MQTQQVPQQPKPIPPQQQQVSQQVPKVPQVTPNPTFSSLPRTNPGQGQQQTTSGSSLLSAMGKEVVAGTASKLEGMLGLDLSNRAATEAKLASIKATLSNPETKAKLKEMFGESGQVIAMYVDALAPALDEVSDKLIPVVENKAQKLIDATLQTGTNLVEDVAGPIVGIPRTIMTGAEAVENGIQLVGTGINGAEELVEKTKANVAMIQQQARQPQQQGQQQGQQGQQQQGQQQKQGQQKQGQKGGTFADKFVGPMYQQVNRMNVAATNMSGESKNAVTAVEQIAEKKDEMGALMADAMVEIDKLKEFKKRQQNNNQAGGGANEGALSRQSKISLKSLFRGISSSSSRGGSSKGSKRTRTTTQKKKEKGGKGGKGG